MDEKIYLECDDCSEVFDDVEIAYGHVHDPMIPSHFVLKTEEEVF